MAEKKRVDHVRTVGGVTSATRKYLALQSIGEESLRRTTGPVTAGFRRPMDLMYVSEVILNEFDVAEYRLALVALGRVRVGLQIPDGRSTGRRHPDVV